MAGADIDTVLGRGGLIINILCLAGAAMFLGFAVDTATYEGNTLGLTIRDAALYGLISAVLLLGATTSVRREGSYLLLVRLVSVTTLPLRGIKHVSGDDGLEVVMDDGVTYTHIGYGSSLLGSLTGNRRAVRVARRIEEAAAQVTSSSTSARDGSATRSPRPGLCWFILLPSAYAVIAGVAHG